MNVDNKTYQAMNTSQLAYKYNVTVFVFKTWLANFIPELLKPGGSYTYTPKQVAQIVAACGEFPES